MNLPKRISYLLLLLFLACQPATKLETAVYPFPTIAPQSYLVFENFPSKNIPSRDIEVWLPKKYHSLDALPVLYMFDGQNIFHGTSGWSGEFNEGWQVDEVLDSLIEAKVIQDIMVVGIPNSPNRMSEYMPAKPSGLVKQRIAENTHDWYKQFATTPPESNEQLKFIVEELKPFIDANFKTKKDPANTFIAGSSMGGLISAYAICEYPEVFGGAACFSTHWPPLEGVFLEYLKENLPDPSTHKIYFDYGTEGLDAEYEAFQKIADAAMEKRGFIKDKNWKTIKFEGHTHHEKDWHRRFHIPMEFLLNNY